MGAVTPETLGDKQRRFTRMVGELIVWAYRSGYELTFGDAYRSPEEAKRNADEGKGIANSLHCQRLAVDLNLFINGEYQTNADAYRPLGEYRKTLAPDVYWGGDFTTLRDADHFSLSPDGGRTR